MVRTSDVLRYVRARYYEGTYFRAYVVRRSTYERTYIVRTTVIVERLMCCTYYYVVRRTPSKFGMYVRNVPTYGYVHSSVFVRAYVRTFVRRRTYVVRQSVFVVVHTSYVRMLSHVLTSYVRTYFDVRSISLYVVRRRTSSVVRRRTS